MYLLADRRKATHNSTLAMAGFRLRLTVLGLKKVQFSEQTFVLKSPPIANLHSKIKSKLFLNFF
jgi:hypothetical protein